MPRRRGDPLDSGRGRPSDGVAVLGGSGRRRSRWVPAASSWISRTSRSSTAAWACGPTARSSSPPLSCSVTSSTPRWSTARPRPGQSSWSSIRVRFMSAAGVAVFCLGHHGRAGGRRVPAGRRAGGGAVVPPCHRSHRGHRRSGALRPGRRGAGTGEPRPRVGGGDAGGGSVGTATRTLAPLFAERVRFPVDHPRQQVPRAELIKGYLPVALHVARKV